MAAHLHRYASELKSLEATTIGVIEHRRSMLTESSAGDASPVARDLCEALSQIRAIMDFEVELEKKIQNNLALVSFWNVVGMCLILTYSTAIQ